MPSELRPRATVEGVGPSAQSRSMRPTDPWWTFVHDLTGRSGSAFYFERGESPGRSVREAFWGFDPRQREIWEEARDLPRSQMRVPRRAGHPAVTWVGYLGFDAVGLFEPLLAPSTPKGSPFPLGVWDGYDRVRHQRGRDPRGSPPAPDLPPPPRLGPVSDSASPRSYEASVERLREAIFDGEAFQIVLAHRRTRRISGGLLPLVDSLRREERFAYLYYLRMTDVDARTGNSGTPLEIAGASPESVVEVRGRRIAVNPIAGTRPRPSPLRGPRSRLPLDKDPKELAEHRMLVDLARNDIGRISTTGSVRLARRETKVPYARLEHLVSRVVGELTPGRDALDALASTFPAGTVSGAPKIRATELLRREERTWRGPYGGAVGLLRAGGTGRDSVLNQVDFALTIRSAFAMGGKVHASAGAGIVHLSSPEREWEETLTKLSTLESSLAGGGKARRPDLDRPGTVKGWSR